MRSPVETRPHRRRLGRPLQTCLTVVAAGWACLAVAPAEPVAVEGLSGETPVAVQPGFTPGQPAPVLLERGRLLLTYARQWVC